MELWIARDKDSNELWLYDKKPLINEINEEQYKPNLDGGGICCIELLDKWFLEVTFENSPRKIKIELL